MATQAVVKTGRKPRSNRGWIIAGSVVGALALLGLIWWRGLTAAPNITIPQPTMPSPNAFDTFVKACNRIQDDKAIGEAITSRPVAGQHLYTLSEKADLVAKNAGALALLREGFAQEYMHPPARSNEALFPHFAKFRGMARLLMLESEVYAARKEWAKSLDSSLDAMELGIMSPRGAVLIGELVGIACEAIGRRPAWSAVDNLSASEAKAAAARLEKILAKRFSYADTLEEEKRFGQAILMDLFRDPNWRMKSDGFFSVTGDEDSGDVGGSTERIAGKARLHLYSNARFLQNYSGYMDASIAHARMPYATRPPAPSMPNDPLSEVLLPVFDQAQIKDLDTQAEDSMLLVKLALRAYYAENGAYPQSLNGLVPKYLTQIPSDTFGTGPLQYRHKGDKYLLYSIGPDKQDNGGKPIDDPSKISGSSSRARYLVQPGSKGDIVLGINAN